MRDLNYQLKQLCRQCREGSYAMQVKRERMLTLIANQLHALGYRGMAARSLKPKHVEALVKHWFSEELSTGTIKNRIAVIRWWAQKVDKQNVVARNNEHYGIPDRRCKTQEYRGLIEQARRQVPDFNVTTDIIVGFPGETDQEWRETLEFVDELAFGHLHIFAYSPRQGTKAAQLPDPVSREIKRQRSEILHALGEKSKRQMLRNQLGRTLPVLVEGSAETGWSGYTPNYLRVAIEAAADRDLGNRIVDIELTALDAANGQLRGQAVL